MMITLLHTARLDHLSKVTTSDDKSQKQFLASGEHSLLMSQAFALNGLPHSLLTTALWPLFQLLLGKEEAEAQRSILRPGLNPIRLLVVPCIQ